MSVNHSRPYGNDLKAVSSEATTSASPNPSASISHVTPNNPLLHGIAQHSRWTPDDIAIPEAAVVSQSGLPPTPLAVASLSASLPCADALQRKSCLWFLGKAFQFCDYLHGVTHDYHCTCCTQGFVFAPLFRG
jgi:hypothetical protein